MCDEDLSHLGERYLSIAVLIPVPDKRLPASLNDYSPYRQVTPYLWEFLVGGPQIRDADITHYCAIFSYLTDQSHEYCA